MPQDPYESLGSHWPELLRLSDRIYRRGFDEGRTLICADHEIRGLAAHRLKTSRYLILAGDKLGHWHAGVFDLSDPGRDRALNPLPLGGGGWVVDQIHFVSLQGRSCAVLGTRGGGAWLILADGLLEQGPGTELNPQPLTGTEGREIQRLLWDGASETLWAASGCHLLEWRLAGPEPALVGSEDFGCRITALAIDRGPSGQEAEDDLYLATNRMTLHRVRRQKDGFFPARRESFEEGRLWRGRLSVIEHLHPLSAIQCRPEGESWQRVYPQRGVIAATLRHLLLIHDDENHEAPYCQSRLVVARSKILSLLVVNLPGWQGVAVSTLEGVLRIYRPSGVRAPDETCDPPLDVAPESCYPTTLLTGYDEVPRLGRIYGGQALEPEDAGEGDEGCEIPIIFARGDNRVQLLRFRPRWAVRRQARQVAERMAEAATSPAELIADLQRVALAHRHSRREKNALTQLLPEVGKRCPSDEQWREFLLLIWDILGTSRSFPSVPLYVIQALRALQDEMGLDQGPRHQEIEETIFKIRKYVLDRRSFSGKETHFFTLQGSKDPGLADDRAIYRSILIARRVDPLFVEDYSHLGFGEIQLLSRVPWPAEEEGRDRFVAATYGGRLWLLDDRGQAVRLHGNPDGWGAVRGCFFRSDDLVLAFEAAPLQSVPRSELTQISGQEAEVTFSQLWKDAPQPPAVTCFCPLPGEVEGEGARFVFGDRGGGIHLFSEDGWEPLVETATESSNPSPSFRPSGAIQHLAPFRSSAADGAPVDFLAVAIASGEILVYRWAQRGALTLEPVHRARVTAQPLTAFLVLGGAQRRLFAGTADGRVMGYRLVPAAQEEGTMRLALGWTVQTGATVRSIQRLDPSLPVDGDVRGRMILAGSHDQSVYLLDVEGRHIEIFVLRDFKVDLFITRPSLPQDDESAGTSGEKVVESRVFACAFEERFTGLRVINRPKLIKRFNERSLPKRSNSAGRERALTRWRAYSLQEGHLRHRFILQSQRYPGPSPRDAIDAIRHLIQSADIENTEELTGEVTALLRRLFQLHPPGEPQDDKQGLAAILKEPDLYLETLRLMRELEERWDTPGSIQNRRVRLFWIRSFLRAIADERMFRRWFECGKELQDQEPLARPGKLLQHFLEGPSSRVQLKTLQYLERLLFGWPGVDRRGLLEQVNRWEMREEVDELLDAIHHRIARSLQPGIARPADSVLLQACRLLSLMLCHGHLDPLYLVYQIEVKHLPRSIFRLLQDQLLTLTDTSPRGEQEAAGGVPKPQERALEAARILGMGEKLGEQDRGRGLTTLEVLIAHCAAAGEGNPDEEYCREAGRYFESLMPLLESTNLERLHKLASEWSPPEKFPSLFYPSLGFLGKIAPFLRATQEYWYQKHNDLHSSPLEALNYADVYDVQRTWARAREVLTQERALGSDQERRLIKQLVDSWEQIVGDERDNHLLQDFSSAIKEYFEPVGEVKPGSEEALALKDQEEGRALTAFANLFIRLLLFAEPSEAIYLYRWRQGRTDEVRGRWFQANDDGSEPRLMDIEGDIHPEWMDSDWIEVERFCNLGEEELLSLLQHRWPHLEWRVNPIAGRTEKDELFGLYIFAWQDAEAPGCRRFDRHRLVWSMPVEAMVFRRAALEQELLKVQLFSIIAHELRGPIHHLRSDLGTLVDGFLEDQEGNKRFDKYRELLRAARRLDNIVQGVLSIQGRTVTVVKAPFSLARMLYELVRTARKEAGYRNISIDFARPTGEEEEATNIESDETKVYDIVSNLLTNAIKYSPPSTRVKLNYTVTSHGAEVRVEDEGPGIPADELPFIFDLYFRGSIPKERNIPGLGMGLYTARLYTTALGGRLQVQSSRDEGSVFKLYLPYVRAGKVAEVVE